MKITYDPQADAMFISLQTGKYELTDEIGEGILVHHAKNGKILSIEILDVRDKMPQEVVKYLLTTAKITAAR